MGKITSNDVAILAGVSRSTVSRVLSGDKKVKIGEETKRKVFEAAKKLHYTPNEIARSLVTGKTNKILLMLPHVYQQYFASILYCFQNLFKETPYEIILWDRSNTNEWVMHTPIHEVLKWTVDGIISLSCTIIGDKKQIDVPLVYFGEYDPNCDFENVILMDFQMASKETMNYFLKNNHKKIAFLATKNSNEPWNNRLIAYKEFVKENNLEEILILSEINSSMSAKKALEKFLNNNKNKIDAIFCWNDYMAIGAHSAINACGKKIPEDIALIGFDGIEERLFFTPPITSVKIPIELVCSEILKMLFAKIENPSLPPQKKIITPKLDIQGTV